MIAFILGAATWSAPVWLTVDDTDYELRPSREPPTRATLSP
jgi:hypothetical protein